MTERLDWDGENEFEDDDTLEDEDEETFYNLTEAGYRKILSWMRFQVQMCELEHEDMEHCEDDTHQVAFLLSWIVLPLMQHLGIDNDAEVPADSADAPLLEPEE